MNKKSSTILFCLLFCLIISASGFAQTSLAGKVVDSSIKPLNLASVILFQGNNFISTTVTDNDGHFAFPSKNYQLNEKYEVRVSLVGYQSYTRQFVFPDTLFLKSIVLQADHAILNSVTVNSSSRSIISRKSDRLIINVENSFLANGNSALDVLQKSPGIWVNNNGSIRIKGSQPVTVMIDDVVQRMSEDQLSEYLKTLKSEDISKIEVITNPPAEFEAAGTGGIVHIILKKPRKDGLNGSINGQYKQQGAKPYWTLGSNIDYKVKRFYFLGSYSVIKDIKEIDETADILYANSNQYHNYSNRLDNVFRDQYKTGLAFDLSAKQSLGLQYTATQNFLDKSFSTNIQEINTGVSVSGNTTALQDRKLNSESITLNYINKLDSLGSVLKIITDYSDNIRSENNNFTESYSDPSKNIIYRNNSPNATYIYTAQSDYTKVVTDKTIVKSGVKFATIQRNNEVIREDYISGVWTRNVSNSDNFIYKEKLLMLYSSIDQTFGKTTFKLGLRGEQTYSSGNSVTINQQFSRSYFGLFPSLFINHTLNSAKGSSLYFNYSRRVGRPSLSDLNPNRLLFNNYTAQTGNPDLEPQFTNSLELGWNLPKDVSVNLYYQYTSNLIALTASAGLSNFIEYRPENLAHSTEYGLNMSAPLKVTKIWTINNNLLLYRVSYPLNNVYINQTSLSAKMVHVISIKGLFDADAVADFRSATIYSNLATPATFSMDIGLARRIFNNKGRVRMVVSDIFNTLREREITDDSYGHIDFYRKRPTRSIGLSFTYNFNYGKKFLSKKVEQSGAEERGRIGN